MRDDVDLNIKLRTIRSTMNMIIAVFENYNEHSLEDEFNNMPEQIAQLRSFLWGRDCPECGGNPDDEQQQGDAFCTECECVVGED